MDYHQNEQPLIKFQGLKTLVFPDYDTPAPKLEILNSNPSATPKGGLSLWQLRLVQDFINDYLGSEIKQSQLATLIGMSPAYFSKKFKRSTGLSPHRYLIQQRVERAKGLLSSADIRIAEISQLVGFFDQSHLVRHFKTLVGITPKDYRDSKLEK